MDLQSLQAFVAISEYGSFSRAAERLHLTQPAVSKRMRNLEQQLDTVLFDRVGRTIHLTDSGQALLPAARRILQEMDNATRTMHNLDQQVAGTLSFTTSHHIGLHRLPRLLRNFTQTHPEVVLDIHFQESELAYDAVVRREVEFAFVTLIPDPPASIAHQRLWRDAMHYVAAPQHELARESALTLADLAQRRAILPAESSMTWQLIKNQFTQRQLPLQTTLPVNYLETIKMMVTVGLGWSVLPESMLDAQLVRLAVASPPVERDLGVIWLPDRTLSNAALAFLHEAGIHHGSTGPNLQSANAGNLHDALPRS